MVNLKETDGSLITDKSEIIEKFREMFETILFKSRWAKSVDQYTATEEQMTHGPTMGKIEMAIKKLKNGKTPEEGNITTELLTKSGKL